MDLTNHSTRCRPFPGSSPGLTLSPFKRREQGEGTRSASPLVQLRARINDCAVAARPPPAAEMIRR